MKLSDITKIHMNERDVEAPAVIQFVRGLCDLYPGLSLLDVGAHYSHATYAPGLREIIGDGLYDAIDMLPDEKTAEIVNYYHIADVNDYLPKMAYGVVTCVSVIEHCGIKGYRSHDIWAERMRVFDKLLSLSSVGTFLTFPFGEDGLYPDEYANFTSWELFEMCWIARKQRFDYDLEFWFNEFSPGGHPWQQMTFKDACRVPLDPAKGVRCVCLFSLIRN